MPGAGRRRGDTYSIQQIRVILCLRLLWRRMIASGQVVEDVFRKLSKRCAHAQLVMDMRRDFEKENGLDGSDCIVMFGRLKKHTQ